LVLVCEASLIRRIGGFQGYYLGIAEYLGTVLKPVNNFFLERDRAEKDHAYKQLIPYIVLRCGDSVFSYVRGRKSSESRLVAKRSIGVGGHIEPVDMSLFSSDRDMYLEAARREVREEIELDTQYTERIVALINDDSTDVGKVHLGIMHIWDLAEPKVSKREGLITQAGFLSIESLQAKWDELETWSQIALQVLQDPRTPPYGCAHQSPAHVLTVQAQSHDGDSHKDLGVQAGRLDGQGTNG
jgi:predicted NUDIX family phosphoesterase